MARIGYARVSTADQDYGLQERELKIAGCEIIRAEKASGGSREGRDELASVLEFIRANDELVVVKLDRLGRSTRDVLNLVHELDQRGAYLEVLEPRFTTREATSHILITVLGMVAETERRFIRERQQLGIDAAKARGVYRGRKPSVSPEAVMALSKTGKGPTAIAKELGISRVHAHRLVQKWTPSLA